MEKSFLFNEMSGQTHVLNQLATNSIELLKQQPLAEEELFKRLAVLYEGLDFNDTEVYNYIVAMLANLDELGLIEPYTA